MNKKTKMVYVTKNALTRGIEYIEVNETSNPDFVVENVRYPRSFFEGEWFENREDAVKKAEELRIKKLQSLDKQMKKMSNLKFD